MNNKTKVERFVLSLIPNDQEKKVGSCTSTTCETLDGKKGTPAADWVATVFCLKQKDVHFTHCAQSIAEHFPEAPMILSW